MLGKFSTTELHPQISIYYYCSRLDMGKGSKIAELVSDDS